MNRPPKAPDETRQSGSRLKEIAWSSALRPSIIWCLATGTVRASTVGSGRYAGNPKKVDGCKWFIMKVGGRCGRSGCQRSNDTCRKGGTCSRQPFVFGLFFCFGLTVTVGFLTPISPTWNHSSNVWCGKTKLNVTLGKTM